MTMMTARTQRTPLQETLNSPQRVFFVLRLQQALLQQALLQQSLARGCARLSFNKDGLPSRCFSSPFRFYGGVFQDFSPFQEKS